MLSIIRQRFRCLHCGRALAFRYFFIEFLVGSLFVVFLSERSLILFWQLFWLLSTLVLAVIDCDTYLVEERIFLSTSLFLVAGGLILHQPIYWWQPLILLLCSSVLQRYLPDSLGMGDVWLTAVWSLLLTGYKLLVLLFIASGSGLLFFMIQRIRQKPLREVPFVPFLFCGLLVVLLSLKKA
ncbi:hypothetical protein NRIC_24930 [Enterococcus florum]|uniref:Prepilin type IV endopeptidase peptidase domain-containing protein n=1 Tax=Enterococcus florum TaxID=2480627 RepID=A0A4P5PG25_9ENTE|nr:hypothetical protein NRIC_24930 [Enterococcus florum]